MDNTTKVGTHLADGAFIAEVAGGVVVIGAPAAEAVAIETARVVAIVRVVAATA